MDKSSGIFIILAILFAGVLIMGCSSSDSSSSGSTAQPSVTATTASSAALYSAGDIVKNPKSSSTSALIIIGYDAGSDTYERAYIYPNSDGSWGYRLDSKTEKISRSTIEKVYTQKLGTKTVSAVPIGTPTTIATPTPVYTTSTTSATATTTATQTTSTTAPHVKSVDPDTGKTGTTVSITSLKGTDFQSGATVSFVKGNTIINATAVSFTSSSLMSCSFVIPSDATTGMWDVKVTNPDGQFHQFQNGFTVTQGTTSTSTVKTTSTTTTATSVTITQIQDTVLVTGGTEGVKDVTVLGTNLSVASKMQLVGGSTINSNAFTCDSSTRCKGIFTIPAGVVGTFYVKVADSSGVLAQSSGTLTIQ